MGRCKDKAYRIAIVRRGRRLGEAMGSCNEAEAHEGAAEFVETNE